MRSQSSPRRWPKLLGALIAACTTALPPTAHAFAPSKPAAPGASSPKPTDRLVNINTASRAELKTLPGIGDAEAERIVAHRPYATKTHLVEKQVLGEEAYDRLRRLIVVEHRRGAASRPKP